MKGMSILDAWLSFEGDVIPLDAPPIQHVEMRRAFYSGAIAILQFTEQIAEIPDERAGMQMLERLHIEKRAFINEMDRLAKEQK
jgi:hypothetical protein